MYIMSHENIGRLTVERKQLQLHLVDLGEEASKIGNELVALGQDLNGQPHLVAIAGQPQSSIDGKGHFYSSSIFDPGKIAKLTQDIRDTSRRIDEIATELSKAGL
jgi:hypothetical protein